MGEQLTPSPASWQAKHETTDVQSKPLVLSALGLAVSVGLVCLFLIWFFDRLESRASSQDPLLSPLVGSQIAPPPRLQTSPAYDVARLRAAEDQALHSYRWIDKRRGVVQLPIDRAIDLLLEEGLPETKAEATTVEPSDKKEDQR
jgi:hypothetical protein